MKDHRPSFSPIEHVFGRICLFLRGLLEVWLGGCLCWERGTLRMLVNFFAFWLELGRLWRGLMSSLIHCFVLQLCPIKKAVLVGFIWCSNYWKSGLHSLHQFTTRFAWFNVLLFSSFMSGFK